MTGPGLDQNDPTQFQIRKAQKVVVHSNYDPVCNDCKYTILERQTSY